MGTTAVYFDGDGDYLTVGDSEDWSFGVEDFTIDLWFQAGGGPCISALAYCGLFTQVVNESPGKGLWFILTLAKLRFFARDGNAGKRIFSEIFGIQKKRIYNALLNSNSEEVLNFDNILSKIING